MTSDKSQELSNMVDAINILMNKANTQKETQVVCQKVSEMKTKWEHTLKPGKHGRPPALPILDEWFELFSKSFSNTLKKTQNLVEQFCSNKDDKVALECLKSIVSHLLRHGYEIDIWISSERERTTAPSSQRYLLDTIRYFILLDERREAFESLRVMPKSLLTLNNQYSYVIQPYIQKCIFLHQSVPARGLVENVQEFLNHYTMPPLPLSSADQTRLQNALSRIDIPLNYIYMDLKADSSSALERKAARRAVLREQTDDDPELYRRLAKAPLMPSLVERDRAGQVKLVDFVSVLQVERWLVILGDPGSGKTTFVRWLTFQYANAVSEKLEFVRDPLSNSVLGPARMPILIRVGELAEFIRFNGTSTLFDYIGRQTWMGISLFDGLVGESDARRTTAVVQEYVIQGRALVILDGLDEIPASEHRRKIVQLVREFVGLYILTPLFVSAYDDVTTVESRVINPRSDNPLQSGGNQLIVTSRIVGYYAQPLTGDFIAHYIIMPMSVSQTNAFIDRWYSNVHSEVVHIISSNLPKLKKNQINTEFQRAADKLKSEVEKSIGLKQLASNALLAFIICSLSYRTYGKRLPKQRVHLYHDTITAMLHIWKTRGSTISEHTLNLLLIVLATHIHQNSPSGLIEEFDMKRLCKKELTQLVEYRNDASAREKTADEFVRLICEDVGVLAARGEKVYGFLHLTFQEYFTCLNTVRTKNGENTSVINLEATTMITDEEISEVIDRFLYHVNDPRFREPLFLALGWISWKWNSNNYYNLFCLQLIAGNGEEGFNEHLPLGALLLVSAFGDLDRLPSKFIIFDAFNRLLTAAGKHDWQISYPEFQNQIVEGLNQLEPSLASECVLNFIVENNAFSTENVSALCSILPIELRVNRKVSWLTAEICEAFANLLPLDDERNGFSIDLTLCKITTVNHRLLPTPAHSLKYYLLNKSIATSTIHPSILALIIAICGGLYNHVQGSQTAVLFSPLYMHRTSPLSTVLIEYFTNASQKPHSQRCQRIVEYCKSVLQRSTVKDRSLEVVDCFIALLTLMGVEFFSLNDDYSSYTAFSLALNRHRRSLMQIRHYFKSIAFRKSVEMGTYLVDEFFEFHQFSSFEAQSTRPQFDEVSIKKLFAFVDAVAVSLTRISSCWKALELKLPDVLGKKKFVRHLMKLATNADQSFPVSSTFSDYMRLQCPMVDLKSPNIDLNCLSSTDVFKFRSKNHPMILWRDNLAFLPAFVPQPLQHLFLRMIMKSKLEVQKNPPEVHTLTELHLLTEVITAMKYPLINGNRQVLLVVLLLPLFRYWKIEHYALASVWKQGLNEVKKNFYEFYKQLQKKAEPEESLLKAESSDIKLAVAEERKRIQETLLQLDQTIKVEDADLQLYAAAISLAHLSSCATGIPNTKLFNEARVPVELITDPVLKIRALSVMLKLASHEVAVEQLSLLQETLETVVMNIKSGIPILLYSFVVVDCIPLLQSETLIERIIKNIFLEMEQMNANQTNDTREDQMATCEALCSLSDSYSPIRTYLDNFFQICGWPVVGFLTKCLHLSSVALKDFLSPNATEKCRSHNKDESHSIFYACLLLCETIIDTHQLTKWMNRQSFLQSKQITTLDMFNIASEISKKLSQLENDPTQLQLADSQLRNHSVIYLSARAMVSQWLHYSETSSLYILSGHAALLLAASNFFSVLSVDVVCRLLMSEKDRFRQRAELILSRQRRLSSQLGWDVLYAFIRNWVYYRSRNAYVSVVLLWMFERVEINDLDHMSAIMQIELDRTRFVLYEQAKGEEFLNDNDDYKEFQLKGMDVNVSIAYLIHNTSTDVMKYFTEYIISLLSAKSDRYEGELYDQHLSMLIFHVGRNIFSNHPNGSYPLELLANTLKDLLSKQNFVKFRRIQQAVGAALGFNIIGLNARQGSRCYLRAAQLYAKLKKKLRTIEPSNRSVRKEHYSEITAILIEATSHTRLDIHYGSYYESQCLGSDLDKLLQIFGPESYELCCAFLIASSGYFFVSQEHNGRMRTVAQFIVRHPSLLPKFINDLYDSVKHIASNVHYGYESYQHVHFGDPSFVEVAAELVKEMPAAFCAEVQRSSFGEANFKKALYCTSIQHRFPRRVACIEVLSIFGQLTVDMSKMFVSALQDSAHLQRAVFRCVSRIREATREAIEYLYEYLNSDSMNARYTVAKLLVNLAHQDVVSVREVQRALVVAMEDPSAQQELWIIKNHEGADATERMYVCLSRLNQALYGLLVQLSFLRTKDSIEQTFHVNESESLTSTVNSQFEDAIKAAGLATCMIKNEVSAEQG